MRSANGLALVLIGVLGCGSTPEDADPTTPEPVIASEPTKADAVEPTKSDAVEPTKPAEPDEPAEPSEPTSFTPATRGSGNCEVTVSTLLEAKEYRGAGPFTPALAASLDADPDHARRYNSESHGDHHIQCHYQVELAHQPGKHYRWETWFSNTLRDRTIAACNGMAIEVADAVIRSTKDCTDLAADAYYGHVLAPM